MTRAWQLNLNCDLSESDFSFNTIATPASGEEHFVLGATLSSSRTNVSSKTERLPSSSEGLAFFKGKIGSCREKLPSLSAKVSSIAEKNCLSRQESSLSLNKSFFAGCKSCHFQRETPPSENKVFLCNRKN